MADTGLALSWKSEACASHSRRYIAFKRAEVHLYRSVYFCLLKPVTFQPTVKSEGNFF